MNGDSPLRDTGGLREGAARYRSLVEASSEIVWTNSPDGRMVGEQPGWASITGQSFDEYQGFGWADAVHPDDREPTIAQWNEAVAAKSLFTAEHRVRTPDGSWRTYGVRAVPVLEDDGSIREWVGVHSDVTEQRALERQADELARRYQALVETLPFQVWSATPDGALDYVSPEAVAYFGRSAEQLIGEGWQSVLHPSDLAGVAERWTHSLATGEPYQVEFRLLCGANSTYRWHVGRAVAVRDDDGRIVKWIGSNADIDEQKRALEVRDAALARASIERARAARIFDHVPAVVAVLRGAEHTIATVNAKWDELVGKANVVGKPIRDVFPDLEEQGIVDAIDGVFASGEASTNRGVRVLLDRDGKGAREATHWDFTFQPLTGPAGAVESVVAYGLEITELVRLRREVEELRAAVGRA